MLLERGGFAVAERPDLGHLHRGRRSGVLVLPREVPDRHDGVTVGNELLGHHREVVTDLSETHEDVLEHPLGADDGAGDRVAVGFGPLDVVSEDRKRQAERAAERTALIEELKRATGLGGRPRRSGSPADKARVNVTRTIRHAIRELASRAPDLAAHLEESIVTGVACCYEPRVDIVWTT